MKKLKLTIAGEVKTFDLPKNGEYKCEVEEHYVPKVGDCVKIECRNPRNTTFYWFKIKEVVNAMVDFSLTVEEDLSIAKNGFFSIDDNRIYTQITPEELKAKYAEAGYDWDYESDTIKPLKWVPRSGNKVWLLNSNFEPIKTIFYENNESLQTMLEKDLLFRTKAECRKFADHCMSYINNKKE